MPPPLTTPRLLLRPFSEDDIPAAYAVFEGHPDVWKYDPGFQRTYEQRAEVIRHYAANNDLLGEGTLAVTLKDGTLIGYVGLQLYILPAEPLATPEVELYYKLGRDWWRQGYATEACRRLIEFAFNEMRLVRIVTVTHKDNVASLRLMARLGMKLDTAPSAWPDDVIGILKNPRRKRARP